VIAQPSTAVQMHATPPAPTAVTAFVGVLEAGPANVAVLLEDYAGFEAVFGAKNKATTLAMTVYRFFANAGKTAYDESSTSPDAGVRASHALHQGIYALEEVELFNLLCLPGIDDAAVLQAAEEYCRDRGALLLADAPVAAETPEQVLAAYAAWPRSSHAAVFHPWLFVETQAGKRMLAPPCGGVAGMLARNDAARGAWKAPAGNTARLEGVRALHAEVSEAQARKLAESGVNCLRMASSLGAVCWSARTRYPEDLPMPQLAHIPARRMANFREDSLVPALDWTRFERNDAPLWTHIAAQAEEFMHGLFTAGAFQGMTEAEAYSVRCGTDSIRPEDLSQGRVGIDLRFAPSAANQFVQLRVHCLAEPR
jgi:phage tail sheath protein FI